MGCQETSEANPVPISKESSSQGKATAQDPSTVKLPFKIMNAFIVAFSHLEQTLSEEFAQNLTTQVKEQVLKRLETMTERDLKDVDKYEIQNLVQNMREFL